MMDKDEAFAARFEGFSGDDGASPDDIAKIEDSFGRKLPEELCELLLAANGLGGVIGGHELQIWSCEEIVAYNRAVELRKYSPAFLMFGTDGTNETYTLDYRHDPPSVVLIPGDSPDYENAILLGRDFISFLDRMKDPRSFFDQ